jgi:hypothetical protein
LNCCHMIRILFVVIFKKIVKIQGHFIFPNTESIYEKTSVKGGLIFNIFYMRISIQLIVLLI